MRHDTASKKQRLTLALHWVVGANTAEVDVMAGQIVLLLRLSLDH